MTHQELCQHVALTKQRVQNSERGQRGRWSIVNRPAQLAQAPSWPTPPDHGDLSNLLRKTVVSDALTWSRGESMKFFEKNLTGNTISRELEPSDLIITVKIGFNTSSACRDS